MPAATPNKPEHAASRSATFSLWICMAWYVAEALGTKWYPKTRIQSCQQLWVDNSEFYYSEFSTCLLEGSTASILDDNTSYSSESNCENM